MDTKKAQMHLPSLGDVACLVFKKLSRVGLSTQAFMPKTGFIFLFFFQGEMIYHPPLIF